MTVHVRLRSLFRLGVLAALATFAIGGVPPPATALGDTSIAVAAITADGTAVYISGDGEHIELMEDDPTTSTLHSVAVTADGQRAWLTTCCEPVWGQWWEIAVGEGPVDPSPGAGYAFDLNPRGDRFVSLGYFGVAVRDLDGRIAASEDLLDDPVPRDAYDTMWLDDGVAVMLEFVQPDAGNEFRLVTTDEALTGYGEATGTVIAADVERPWPRLAGATEDGSILVSHGRPTDGTTRRLHAYDPATLRRTPAHDVRLPGPATWAWSGGGHLLWIDRHHVLRVDGAPVDGRFTWARTSRIAASPAVPTCCENPCRGA